ncbi:MAG TPA: hypothetical protein VEN81_10215 [Planctomycetota bacterium]|nr:hypothetical protein [Planctomycetota bacterium]
MDRLSIRAVALALGALTLGCDRPASPSPTVSGSGSAPAPSSTPSALPLGAEEGAFFWFNSRVIADAGHPFYGPFAYTHLLPYFSPRHQKNPSTWYVLCDGDCLGRKPAALPRSGPKEEKILSEVDRIGPSLCYIIAAFGQGTQSYSRIDQELSTAGVLGYLGMTSLPGVDRAKYVELTRAVALPISARIDGGRFKRISFDSMDDAKLQSLGFGTVVDREKD